MSKREKLDPAAVARARLTILEEVAAIEADGVSLRRACLLCGESPATILRWRRALAAEGQAGLEPKTGNCGRKLTVTLNDEEERLAKQLYAQTGSKTSALRLLATHPDCREEVSEVILKQRRSKHTLTKSLRNQIDLPTAVMNFHKSPKNTRINAFVCPRSLTYIDGLGTQRDLQPGDLYERDDMSNNFLCYVEWPWGGDPCSDKFGVRVARGQNLLCIDVRSLFFLSFNFIVRLRDSYRADDIWQWVGNTYRDVGVPRIGERWERGTWASRKLRGDVEAPITAEIDEKARLSGMGALGLRVIESQSPTTKIIENRFNFFQTICSTIPGQIGRSRGEMERENKIWTACRLGHRDPREYFLSFDQVCDQIEAKLHYVNAEPVEGNIYSGVPAAIWKAGLESQPLTPLPIEKGYLFSRNRKELTAHKGHVMARFTRPDGSRGAQWFHQEDLYRYESEKMHVWYDSYAPEEGATLVVASGRDTGKVLGLGELIAGAPQFALGFQSGDETSGADAGIAAYDRKKGFMDAVRSEYRSLGLGAKRLAKQTRADDGQGREAKVTFGGRGGCAGQPDSASRGTEATSRLGSREAHPDSRSARSSKPEKFDADTEHNRLAALEAKYARENGILAP